MIYTPVNAFTWALGSLAAYVFAYKSWRTYKTTKNPLAQIYAWMTAGLATSFFFFGVPALLTNDTSILRYTYVMADILIQITLQLEMWLLWFLGLRNKIQLKYLLMTTSLFSIILLINEAMTSKVAISESPHLVVYSDVRSVLIMKSIIYIGIALPLGYFFLRQVPKQTTVQAKARLLVSALTFITLSVAATCNNLFSNGSDTLQSTSILAGFFVALLFVSLLPSRKSAKPSSRPTISR